MTYPMVSGTTIHDIALYLDGLDSGYANSKIGTALTAADMTKGDLVFGAQELIFNGTSSKITVGALGNIGAVCFMVKPATSTGYLFDFDGTSSINITTGAIATTAITSPSVYVNGIVGTTLVTGFWNCVAVVMPTAVDATAFVIGSVGTDFFEGSLAKIICYSKTLSAEQAGQLRGGSFSEQGLKRWDARDHCTDGGGNSGFIFS